MTPESAPAAVPYVFPDPVKAAAWGRRLGGDGLRVGLVWAGRPQHQNDRNRSCRPEAFSAVAEIDGLRLFSLQKGPAESQLLASSLKDRITHLGPDLADFSDTAAVMSHLDLLISVDTSVAHLAGAMARPAWVLVPAIPDWRWMLGRDDSPWYPAMRLFRQEHEGDWKPVVRRIEAELRKLASGGGAAGARAVPPGSGLAAGTTSPRPGEPPTQPGAGAADIRPHEVD